MAYIITTLPERWMGPSLWLENVYNARNTKNPSYSRRSFARDLGISSGRLAEYLNGSRRITLEKGREFSLALSLNAEEERDLLQSIQADSYLSFHLSRAVRSEGPRKISESGREDAISIHFESPSSEQEKQTRLFMPISSQDHETVCRLMLNFNLFLAETFQGEGDFYQFEMQLSKAPEK